MIIFGTRSMEYTHATGTFHCPRCGTSKPYHHKRVNRWFTLYFIPVIPMGSIGSYVQCGHCAATYGEEVFSYNSEAERQQIFLQLRGLLVLVMLASGKREDADEVRTICDVYQTLTNTSLLPADVRSDAGHARAGNIQLAAFARQASDNLSLQGKAMFVQAAHRVLCAKGSARADAAAVIAQIAEGMQLSSQQVEDILRQPL